MVKAVYTTGPEPMTELFASKALLSNGWAHDVRLRIESGVIREVAAGQSPGNGAERLAILLPGLCNAHSHAFQRALCGFAEQASPAGKDNFWSWRERMYALAQSLDADSCKAVAAQAYCEMLEAGYTSVAEFHYLHRDRDGVMRAAMRDALFEAARETGIRLLYVPVLYERGGFDGRPLEQAQQRFGLDLDGYCAHLAESVSVAHESQAAHLGVAAGAHSLRAVSPESLLAVAAVAAEYAMPLHIHIAEQQREVDECLAATGARPVEWLLDEAPVDRRWCLVHATHIEAPESRGIAAAGAVVCLCPTTEANLGDGLFPLPEFIEQGGQFAIGSDSQVSIDPFEELRWLEYGQRLAMRSRNVIAEQGSHSGLELFTRALAGGAAASATATPGIQAGAPADLLALDPAAPLLAGHDATTLLDALVFGGHRRCIDRVMVAGDWLLAGGMHRHREALGRDYAGALQQLGADR